MELTNQLIWEARLPVVLWKFVHGAHQDYQNPGKSLLSWVIANVMSYEETMVPLQLKPKLEACVSFSRDFTGITQALDRYVDMLLQRYESVNGPKPSSLRGHIEALAGNVEKLIADAKRVYEIDGKPSSEFLLDSVQRQYLINLANVIEGVEDQIMAYEKRGT